MATTRPPPPLTKTSARQQQPQQPTAPPAPIFIPYQPVENVPVTIHSFPSLEPSSLVEYSTKFLHLPLRRDILHMAVVYEGDNTRQGSANSKTRYEVHGSHRKQMQQKGMGRARRGSKQSPILKGGGKTFGPKPRDFGTDLPRKVYDLAWRTALSYRYRRGELVVVEDGMDLPLPNDFLGPALRSQLSPKLEDGFVARYLEHVLTGLRWDKSHGRTTFITAERRPNLFTSLDVSETHGRAFALDDTEHTLDVKNLLETGRLVVERSALNDIIRAHRSDVGGEISFYGSKTIRPLPQGQAVVV